MEEGIKWKIVVKWTNGNKEQQYFETKEEADKWFFATRAYMWTRLRVDGFIIHEGEEYYHKPKKPVKGDEINVDIYKLYNAMQYEFYVLHKGKVYMVDKLFSHFDFYESKIYYSVILDGGTIWTPIFEEGIVNINDYGKTWALTKKELGIEESEDD